MKLDVWCQTDVGVKRSNNQDTFLIDPDLGLYIVADGMGGHLGGEVASAVAVETVKEVVTDSWENDVGASPRELLSRSYREATKRVFERSQKDSELEGMGTTMVATIFRDGVLYVGNVGDSRAYLIRPEGMWQMTEDHSLMNEQLRAGMIDESQLESFTAKNVITRSVGFEDSVDCDVIERNLEPGEWVLVCSDGLTGMVEDRQIFNTVQNEKPEKVVSSLIQQAKDNGGDDNITVLLLKVVEE